MVYYVEPNYLKEGLSKVESNYQWDFFEKIKSIANTIEKDDNPVLMFVKLGLNEEQ